MRRETTQEAIALAKVRFAQIHPFDLDDATWKQLFEQYRPGDILEAIRRTPRDKEAERVYSSLLHLIGKLESQRNEKSNPSWPPPDVTQKN